MSPIVSMSLCADVLGIIFAYLGEDHVSFAKEYLNLENNKMSIDRKYMLNQVLLANIYLTGSILRLYTQNCNFTHSCYDSSEIRFFLVCSAVELCTFVKNTFESVVLTKVKVENTIFDGGVIDHANITKSALKDCRFCNIDIRYISLANTKMLLTFERVYISYMNISMSLHIDVVFKCSKVNIIYIVNCFLKRGIFHKTVINGFNSKYSTLENIYFTQTKINKISLEKSKVNSSKFMNVIINCGEIIHTDFNNTVFENMKMIDVAIENSKINYCKTAGNSLMINDANLKCVVMNRCKLSIIFKKCKLDNVRFSQCELNVEFHDCELADCVFNDNTTRKVLFNCCKFARCVDTQDNLNATHIESIDMDSQ